MAMVVILTAQHTLPFLSTTVSRRRSATVGQSGGWCVHQCQFRTSFPTLRQHPQRVSVPNKCPQNCLQKKKNEILCSYTLCSSKEKSDGDGDGDGDADDDANLMT